MALTLNIERMFGRGGSGLSGEVDEVGCGAHDDLLLLEEGGQGPGVHLVELHELLQAGELGPAPVQ